MLRDMPSQALLYCVSSSTTVTFERDVSVAVNFFHMYLHGIVEVELFFTHIAVINSSIEVRGNLVAVHVSFGPKPFAALIQVALVFLDVAVRRQVTN